MFYLYRLKVEILEMLEDPTKKILQTALDASLSLKGNDLETLGSTLADVWRIAEFDLKVSDLSHFSVNQVGVLSLSTERVSQAEAKLCYLALLSRAKNPSLLSDSELDQLQSVGGQFIGKINAIPPVAGYWHEKLATLGTVLFSATRQCAKFSLGTFRLLHSTSLAYHASGNLDMTLKIQESLEKLSDALPDDTRDSLKLLLSRDYARALIAAGRFDEGHKVADRYLEVASDKKQGATYLILLRASAVALASQGKLIEAEEALLSRPDWTKSAGTATFNPLELDCDLELAVLKFANGHQDREEIIQLLNQQRQASIENQAPNYTASRERLIAICGDCLEPESLKEALLHYMLPG
ncbi:MAG: hypothetical protein R3A13_11500 [Bdellovibrionota bacterium]